MGIKLNYDQKGRLSDRMDEFARVTKNGTREFDKAMDVLQAFIEGKELSVVQAVTESSQVIKFNIVTCVERQLARYEECGFVVTAEVRQRILAQAAAFVPLSATDRPLVTGFFGSAPDTINAIWQHVKLDGYESKRYFTPDTPLRFAPGMRPTLTEPRLMHFEPNSYKGKSPKQARTQAEQASIRLAGIEVIEMLFVEPEWAREWNGTTHPYPNLSALQLGSGWSYVPYVYRWGDGHQLELDDRWGDYDDPGWASPSVREC